MLDPEIVRRTVGKRLEPSVLEYRWQDVVLYALSVGAQADELSYIYENVPGGLQVIPSFSVLACSGIWYSLSDLTLDMHRTVHVGHRMRMYRPIPPQGRLYTALEVVDIYDKRNAAIIVVGADTSTESGELVCRNEAVLLYIGGGGFGGDPGPKTERVAIPEGVEPAFRISYTVPEHQAALYRLTGDYNPIHIDSELAKTAGFDKPLLHGLCSFGYATRAILHGACDADVTRLKEFEVRFTAPVFPGNTLTTEGWTDNNDRYIIRVSTETGIVMSNARTVVSTGT